MAFTKVAKGLKIVATTANPIVYDRSRKRAYRGSTPVATHRNSAPQQYDPAELEIWKQRVLEIEKEYEQELKRRGILMQTEEGRQEWRLEELQAKWKTLQRDHLLSEARRLGIDV